MDNVILTNDLINKINNIDSSLTILTHSFVIFCRYFNSYFCLLFNLSIYR